jgi:hypothetical protein
MAWILNLDLIIAHWISQKIQIILFRFLKKVTSDEVIVLLAFEAWQPITADSFGHTLCLRHFHAVAIYSCGFCDSWSSYGLNMASTITFFISYMDFPNCNTLLPLMVSIQELLYS